MGNRTYLIQASVAEPFQYDDSSPDVLAAAENCIPVFWYSLFDQSSIVENTVPLSDGQTMSYPCLVTSTVEAQGWCHERRPLLEQVTPPSHLPVLEAWLRFIETIQSAFVHLETAEFCMMADDNEEYFRSCLRAYEEPLPEGASLGSSPDWAGMLDVAQIDPDDLDGTVEWHKLAGFSWNSRKVPWESEG